MSYINPYESVRQARERANGGKSLAEIYGVGGQGETPAPAETEDAGLLRKIVGTKQDVTKQVNTGMLRSVEGVADFLIGLGATVGGLPQAVMSVVSEDYRDKVKRVIEYDATEKIMEANDRVYEGITGHEYGYGSIQKEGGTAQRIEQGVGGMLPAVLVSVATMGLAAPAAAAGTAASAGGTAASAASAAASAAKAAKLAQTLSTLTMATGAAGQASQEAYQDGAGFYGGQVYGWARGATEAATEYALGGTTKFITGGGMLPGVRKSVASVGLKRVAKAALEEGLEEGISEGLDPLTRTTYKGKEALTEYADPAFYRRILQATKDGTLTGLVFQGTVGHAMGNTGKAADVREIGAELETLSQKRRNLHNNNRLTAEAEAAIGEAEQENYRVMETVLKKATPEKRAALLKDYGLTGRFSEDGSMTAEFSAELDRRAVAGEGGFDRRTASVEADAEKVAAVLVKEGRTQFTDVDNLSNEARKNLRNLNRVMNVFYDISGGTVGNFVIANESVADNAYYDTETGYTVIGADALNNGINMTRKGVQSWFETALHEAAHGTEGTVAWFGLAKHLEGIEGGKYYNAMLKELGSRGYLDGKAADIRAEAEKISRKLERGEALTNKQAAFAEVYMSESVSIMAELALGNERFARRLLDADASIVEKLLNRIAEAKEALARRKDPEAKAAFAEIRKAEEMFLDALAEKGLRFDGGKIVGASEEDDENSVRDDIDKKQTIRYNKKRYAPQDITTITRVSYNHHAWATNYLTGCLMPEEIGEFSARISEFKNGIYYPCRTKDGMFVFEVGKYVDGEQTTLILTDGDYERPSIEAVYKLHTDKAEATTDVKEFIETNAKYDEIGRLAESFEAYAGSDEKTGFSEFTPYNHPTYEEFDRERRSSQKAGRNSGARKGGRGDFAGTGESVKKSRKANSQTSGKTSAAPSEVSHLTAMQKQTVANYTRAKVYTKAEALQVVEDMARMLDENYGFDGGMGEVSGFVTLTKAVKNDAARQLWQAYNTAKTDAERREIAGKLADMLMSEAKLVTLMSDEELSEARAVVDCLRRYFGKINLSGIGGEIKVSGLDAKALRGRWGAKKGGDSFTADQIRTDIEEVLGRKIPAESQADILFWMNEQIEKAYEVISMTNKALLNGVAIEDNGIRERITRSILDSFQEKGTESTWTRMKEYHQEQVERLKDDARSATQFARLNVRVTALSAQVKDWKAGVFLNQSQPKYQSIFKDTIGQLAKINRGGRLLNPVKTRELIGKLGEWYTEENMKIMGVEFNAEIAGYIQQIADGEGGLTVADMRALESVIEYMKHTAETYQTVWRNGKRVKALPVAREYVKIMEENQKLRVGKIDHIFSSWYMRLYGDPHMLVRYMDKYKSGFYTEMFERMRDGAMKAQIYRKRLEDQITEAMAEYPKYFKELEGRRILLHGADMPVAEAMSLWMSLNRDQAIAGILENGYCFTDDDPEKTYRRVFGFTGDEVIRDKEGNILPQYRQKIDEMQADIWEQLSEGDRAYIQIVYKLLNQDCKKLKRDTDLARMGYSNAIEDFYFPIRRANSAQDVDQQTFFDELGRVSNASFNKNTVKGAKNQLLIEPIQIVMERHIRGVTMYAALGTVIDDYKMLKNLNVDGEQNHNKPVSIATEEPNTWAEGRKYFEQLMAGIQGIKPQTDEVTKVIGKVRGNYARFALAANPKVMATQISSLFAGLNIIDADVMIYAFSDRGRDVFKYSELAELRASENTAAMAQGLLDQAGDKLMAPIGWMDAWVVRRLWVASQYQIAKKGPKLGTEENKKAAAKLLEKVIFETQQNSLATEKSQAARSSSEFQKMMTMFTSDAVKGMGQVLDAFGEITVIRNQARVSGQPVDVARLKAAQRRLGRAAGSLAAVAVYGAILAAIIKKLLDRDDEWTWTDFFSEIGAGMIGGLPIVKEAYECYFGGGYGMEDMSMAAFNDLLASTQGTFEDLGAFVRGDLSGREAMKRGRNILYSLGQVMGLPFRNVYTWSRRLVGIVAPDAAYKMDNVFAIQPFKSDIAKAIEQGDEGRLETVIGVMLDENVGEVTSQTVRQEMKRLVSAGMDVLPRGVGDTVSVDGEAVKLTVRQQAAFKAVYSEANKSVEKMVGLAYYTNASDEAKAKAIKRVYGIYYNRAIEDLLGVELENKNTLLSQAINPEVLAVVLAVCGEITADVGKDGKAIAGSKKRKVEDFVDSLKLRAAQKFIIMGALGYKNKLGEAKVQAYVNGLGLKEAEREALMGYAGY